MPAPKSRRNPKESDDLFGPTPSAEVNNSIPVHSQAS